jgi:hypothetical protein
MRVRIALRDVFVPSPMSSSRGGELSSDKTKAFELTLQTSPLRTGGGRCSQIRMLGPPSDKMMARSTAAPSLK